MNWQTLSLIACLLYGITGIACSKAAKMQGSCSTMLIYGIAMLSVAHGPLLFALAVPDEDPNTPAGDARWQYALDNEAHREGADIRVQRRPMPEKWDWPLAAPLTLEAPASFLLNTR
jgi:hypothetical protein